MGGQTYSPFDEKAMRSIKCFDSIFIHRGFVDLRKSITGLSVIVSEEMGLDLKGKSLFIFTNQRRNRLKVLYFDHSGFAIWYKRLEESKFSWPRDLEKAVVELTADDFELLLSGINIWTRFEKINFEYVV
jgi:transposase